MIKDALIKIIKEKGWLAIESLYFDNGLVVSIENTAGKIALSEAENVLVFLSSVDIIQSETIGNTIAKYMTTELGHVSTLTMASLDSLQRFNMATYFKTSVDKNYEKQPYPTTYLNPSEAELPGLLDTATGELQLNINAPYDHANPTNVKNPVLLPVVQIFDDYDTETNINRAYYNLEYLKDVWFKNKFLFNERTATLTGFSDLI